jgi:hypothetical protein
MKKLLLFSTLVFTQTFAQNTLQYFDKGQYTNLSKPVIYKSAGDSIWGDDFSKPENWFTGTIGQGSFVIGTNAHPQITNSEYGLAVYMDEMSTIGTTASNGFAFFNGVQYIYNSTVVAQVQSQDLWIASDTIDLSNYAYNYITLRFNQRYKKFNYDETYIEISEDGGFTWPTSFIVNDEVKGNVTVQNSVVKLIPITKSANTRIRFRWKSDANGLPVNKLGTASGYGWMIDDVKLIEPYSDEVELIKVFTNDIVKAYDYYSTPLSQVASMIYGGVVENKGVTPILKYLKYEVKISGNQDPVFLDSVEFSLAPGKKDTIWYNYGFQPDKTGTYTLKVFFEDQGVQTNNSLTDEFKITDYLYGHNYPTSGSNTFGFTFDSDDQPRDVGIGNIYECFQDQLLYGIQLNFGAGTKAGTEIDFELWEIVSDIQASNKVPIQEAFTPSPYIVPSPVITTSPIDIVYDAPVQLMAGKKYMVMAKYRQSTTQDVRLKSTTKGNDDLSTVGYGPFGEGSAVNYYVGWSSAPYLSLNFDPTLSLNDHSISTPQFDIAPNPTSGETKITYSVENSENITIEIVDLAGKTLLSINENVSSTGKQTTSFDASSLAPGLYSLKIKSNNIVSSQKFIKK